MNNQIKKYLNNTYRKKDRKKRQKKREKEQKKNKKSI